MTMARVGAEHLTKDLSQMARVEEFRLRTVVVGSLRAFDERPMRTGVAPVSRTA
jgi:hypothetical protein